MGVSIDLGGKRALVTGGNRGIGRSIAERLAEAGADVAVFARNAESVSEAAGALTDAFGARWGWGGAAAAYLTAGLLAFALAPTRREATVSRRAS